MAVPDPVEIVSPVPHKPAGSNGASHNGSRAVPLANGAHAGTGVRLPPQALSRTGIYAHIVGWGMAVPENVLTNEDLAAFVETSDEWIAARTGIRQRHIASEKDSTATLALKAAQRALQVADVLPSEIDLIICATSTAENVFPSVASVVQGLIGANNAGAFDLSAACSGFVYAVNMASQAIRSGSIRSALVIGSETMSRVLDWQDRGTCILFGDGAGAVVLQASEVEGGVLSSVLRSDGTGGDLLAMPSFASSDLAGMTDFASEHKVGKVYMNGGEVFKFATRVLAECIPQAAQQAGIAVSDLRLIVPHQANARILQAAARALRIDDTMFYSNIDRYGNTSAASIPIALCEAIAAGRIQPDDYVAFVGFGGGLTWASMVVRWGAPKTASPSVLNRPRRFFSYTLGYYRTLLSRWLRNTARAMRALEPRRNRARRLKNKYARGPFSD
jgi:3-oxoacyl-[acyl-carrier-protein] synthase-3